MEWMGKSDYDLNNYFPSVSSWNYSISMYGLYLKQNYFNIANMSLEEFDLVFRINKSV